jgi:hypothetical protein
MNARKTAAIATALAVSIAVPTALAAAPAGGSKYSGKTSAGEPVTLRLNGKASRVKRLRIYYTLTCDDGRTSYTYTDVLNPRLRSDHSFAASGTYTGSSDGSQNSFKLSGKVWAKKAGGKFSLAATGTVEGTKLHCKTGKLSWSAKRTK